MGFIKVENIHSSIQDFTLRQLFGFVGVITKFHWLAQIAVTKSCVIQFEKPAEAKAALLLNQLPLGDGDLKVTASDEATMNLATTSGPKPLPIPVPVPVPIPGLVGLPGIRPVLPLPVPILSMPGAPLLPTPFPLVPAPTEKPSSPPPNLALNAALFQMDPARAEEISRTVYVGNISSSVVEEELTKFFASVGPVACCKLAGDSTQPARFAFIEFVDHQSAQAALKLNGMVLADRALKVNHSKNAIVKPVKKSDKDQDDTMKKVLEAQALIASKYMKGAAGAAATATASKPAEGDKDKEKGRDKDRDRERSRSRSRSRRHRSRSRSRDRDRSRDRKRRHDRSRSRDRRRDRSRDRDRDRKRK